MSFKQSKNPDNSIEYPSFVGTIISKSDKGKMKLCTLSKLGTEKIVWINPKDIISETKFDSDTVKIDVKLGSEIIIEKGKSIKVGDPAISKVTKVTKAIGLKPIMGGEECGNCDWRYVTHCTSCSDRNSSQRCARPFFPYP